MRAVCGLAANWSSSTARPSTSTCSSPPHRLRCPGSSTPQGRVVPRLRQEFPELARHYWRARRLWSGSYFAGSVGGRPAERSGIYIEQQRRPHDQIHLRPEGRSPFRKTGSRAWAVECAPIRRRRGRPGCRPRSGWPPGHARPGTGRPRGEDRRLVVLAGEGLHRLQRVPEREHHELGPVPDVAAEHPDAAVAGSPARSRPRRSSCMYWA